MYPQTNKQSREQKFGGSSVLSINSLSEIDELLTYMKETKSDRKVFSFTYNGVDRKTAQIRFSDTRLIFWNTLNDVKIYTLGNINSITSNSEIIKKVLKENGILKRKKNIEGVLTLEKEFDDIDDYNSKKEESIAYFETSTKRDLTEEQFNELSKRVHSNIEKSFSSIYGISLGVTFRRNTCLGYFLGEGKFYVTQINGLLSMIYEDYDTICGKKYIKGQLITKERMEQSDEVTEQNEGSAYSEYEQGIGVTIRFEK